MTSSRFTRAAVAAAAVLAAAGAQALTFTGPAGFAYSYGGAPPTLLSPSQVEDRANGFALRGDYRFGAGQFFLVATRPFSIGAIPERLTSSSREQFKIVIAGGNSGAGSAAELRTRVHYTIEPVPMGLFAPAVVTGSDVLLQDNGLIVTEAVFPGVLQPVLPPQHILATGDYLLKAYFEVEFVPGPPTVFPLWGYLEAGGLTGFSGVEVSLIGTTVPEPAPLAMLAAGLGVLGWRRRHAQRRAARPQVPPT
jgi:hypothetical protein